MKKFFLGTSCLLLVTCSFAQSFGVQVGGNLGSATIKDDQSGLSLSPSLNSDF
jgi:hypothetical protein